MIKIENLKDVKSLDKIEGLEIKTYIPVSTKTMMIESLIDILVRQDEIGIYVINPTEKEVKTKIAKVALYTNIELTDDDYLNYDIMSSNNLFDLIYENIESDATYYTVNDMDKFDDMLEERIKNKLAENSIERVFASKVTDVVNIIDKTMGHVNDMLDKGDPNKIAKYLSKGIEMIAAKMPDFSKTDITTAIKESKYNGIK